MGRLSTNECTYLPSFLCNLFPVTINPGDLIDTLRCHQILVAQS